MSQYEYYRRQDMLKGRFGLRRLIAEQGYPREIVDAVDSLLRELNIEIISDYFDYNEYLKLIQNFKLLPNDAQIALTCGHYGIDIIFTFDEDFKRVHWLRATP